MFRKNKLGSKPETSATVQNELDSYQYFAEKSPEFKENLQQLVSIKEALADTNLTPKKRAELRDLETALRGHAMIMVDQFLQHDKQVAENQMEEQLEPASKKLRLTPPKVF